MRVALGNMPQLCHSLTVTCCFDCNQKKGSKNALWFLQFRGTSTHEKRAQVQLVYKLYAKARLLRSKANDKIFGEKIATQIIKDAAKNFPPASEGVSNAHV
jgi:hypothetical protein